MAHRSERSELYALVWAKPMSKLAKELGVSDVAIAKACRRADSPTPGLGYWARVQHRKRVKRSPLPPPGSKTPTLVQISPGPSTPLRDLPSEIQEEIARESMSEWRITVSKSLSSPHPVVKAWLKDGNRREGGAQPHTPQPWRRPRVERRRLRILSALFRALEKRGQQLVTGSRSPFDVVLVVHGERIEFSLSERQRQTTEELTPEEQRRPMNAMFGIRSRTVLHPTGELIYRIHSWVGRGLRKQWRDTAHRPLEEQLNSIMAGLLTIAVVTRMDRMEREEKQRRWRELQMERARQEEERRREAQRLQDLLQRVARWQQAANIRAYIHAVRSAYRIDDGGADPSHLEGWASWALTQADQIDPISVGDWLTEGGTRRRADGRRPEMPCTDPPPAGFAPTTQQARPGPAQGVPREVISGLSGRSRSRQTLSSRMTFLESPPAKEFE